MRLSTRSAKREILDESDIPRGHLFRNLREIHFINKTLGGYTGILKGVKNLITTKPTGEEIHILDIGSGGGDTLKVIHRRFHKKYRLKLTGVDVKAECVAYAESHTRGLGIRFIRSDYRELLKNEKENFDIIITSLFCHHLTNDEIIELTAWMGRRAELGFVINDLHRHFLAYYGIKWLTRFFSRSYLVRNDAPLSVARSFIRSDWDRLLSRKNHLKYSVQWTWAFRWLVIGRNGEKI